MDWALGRNSDDTLGEARTAHHHVTLQRRSENGSHEKGISQNTLDSERHGPAVDTYDKNPGVKACCPAITL